MNAEPLDLSIVIPAFRESAKIERDIRAAAAFLDSEHLSGEIIVIDDGSPDDTAARAAALAAEIPQLAVFSYAPNRGKGHALRYGFARARGRNVMFADAGLCVPYEIATLGLRMIELGMCRLAHGTRRMSGSVRVRQPLFRRLGSRGFASLIHGLMGVPRYISDTQCGFKVYPREVAQELYGEAFTDGFMFDVEIILRALRKGYTILEFPVLWSNDPDSRFDALRGGAVRNLRELLAIRLALLGWWAPPANALANARPIPTGDGAKA